MTVQEECGETADIPKEGFQHGQETRAHKPRKESKTSEFLLAKRLREALMAAYNYFGGKLKRWWNLTLLSSIRVSE